MEVLSLRKLDRYITVNRRDIQKLKFDLETGLFGSTPAGNISFIGNSNVISTNIQDALLEVSNNTISSLLLKADLVLGKVPISQLPTIPPTILYTLPTLP